MPTYNFQSPAEQVRPPQGMSLGEMINVARGAQAYQQAQQINPLALQQQEQATRKGQIELGVAEQQNKERLNLQTFFSDPANFQTDGVIDLGKLKQVYQIAPLTGTEVVSKLTTLSKAQTEAQKSTNELDSDQRAIIAGPMGVLGRAGVTDPVVYQKELDALKTKYPNNDKLHKAIDNEKRLYGLIGPPGPQIAQAAIRQSESLMTPSQQQSAFGPQAGTLSTGEQIFPTVTTPAVGGMLPRIQMGAQPLADVGIPPTTEVVDPMTGQRRLIGPASQRGMQAAPLTTSVSPAQAKVLEAGGNIVSQDLTSSVAQAKDAPGRIAIFQNIKKFAPESFTGVGGQRKELAAGILNAIGIPAYEQEKVNTEELAKNSALLALAGGNTDAARALAEVATPNKKLNEKAILAIADQMIGIEKMNIARSNYLTPAMNDATQLGQRKLQFDQIADPRIFQEMTPEDVAKLKKSMSAAEQAEMTRKIRLARQMGIIQ